MPTSSRFVVAVHALVSIDVMGGKPVRSEDIAQSAHTSAVVIRKLLSQLSLAGITTSRLGAGGGALLSKPARDIKLFDVYQAVEDTEIFTLHREAPSQHCVVGGNIHQAVLPALQKARAAFEQELANVSIADITAEVASLGKFKLPLVW